MAGPSVGNDAESVYQEYGPGAADGPTDPGTRTVSVPVGTVAGDHLVALIGTSGSTGSHDFGSGSWTLIDSRTWGVGALYVYYHVVAGGDPGSYTIAAAGGGTANPTTVVLVDVKLGDQEDRFGGYSSVRTAPGAVFLDPGPQTLTLAAGATPASPQALDTTVAVAGWLWHASNDTASVNAPARTIVDSITVNAPDTGGNVAETEYLDAEPALAQGGTADTLQLSRRTALDATVVIPGSDVDATSAFYDASFSPVASPDGSGGVPLLSGCAVRVWPTFTEASDITEPSGSPYRPAAKKVRITELPFTVQSGMLGSPALGTETHHGRR